ncbi:RNA polymerase II elongation factor ELL3 isoform X1 [Bufo gargarizans]|uniref:RNA polymerase II elongation factor ELL3 isoform X1 n=1 Tax=Bufo gargarizans TaxID=30331 RepID=UPI001CF0E272|nr:RNA polymerase II elongation factor ELL3 isoform X1 [Bufo gargarizans]
MSRPGEELSGTLSYRTEPRRSPRLSLFHLKLTDSALSCLRDFQKGQGSAASLPQPVITFQENQGYIKIPCPISGSDDRARVFAFYLSREIKDKPQSSFECIRQGTSWNGEKQLTCIGTIQDKITVCATDESYQLTRDRMSQVEKETWSRTAIEIKPGASNRSKCVKISSKNHMESRTESSSPTHRPPVFLTPAAKKCNRVSGERRTIQEWLIHLLALKPCRKHDLIQRLEKSNMFPRDHTELLSALDEVGCLSPKDGKYCLREELYSQVQKDWLGYTPEERQHMTRKHPNNSLSQNYQTTAERARTHHGLSSTHPGAHHRPPDAKRQAEADNTGHKSHKRIKSSHPDSHLHEGHSTSVSTSHSSKARHHLGSETGKSVGAVPENHSVVSQQSHKKQRTHRTLEKKHHRETHKRATPCDGSENEKVRFRQETSPATHLDNTSDWHKKQKKDHESSEEEEEEDDWEEEALMLERCLTSPEEKEEPSGSVSSSEEVADYFSKYTTITSQDQRKLYEDDFASDYTEYLELHAKIAKVLERFVQLGSRMKKYRQGTVEHKVVENKILSEYKKFKKTYPSYREEKIRCEYLHHKLSHIKHLILEYEKNTPT